MTLLPQILETPRTTGAGLKTCKMGPPGPLPKERIKVIVVLKCSIVRVNRQQSLCADETMPAGRSCLIVYLTGY